jgi:hypothetical protein
MRFEQFPIEIRERILELNPAATVGVRLGDAFNWGRTSSDGEGTSFWNNIDQGDYTRFYDKYPKSAANVTNTECVVTTQGSKLIIHSFVSPEPSKMVVNRKEALMLIEKLQAFIDATEEKEPAKKKGMKASYATGFVYADDDNGAIPSIF